MFRKVKKLLKSGNEKKKDKKARSQQAPSDDELFIDKRRFVLTERYKLLWDYLIKHGKQIQWKWIFFRDSIQAKINRRAFILQPVHAFTLLIFCLLAPNADGIFRVPGSQPRIRALKLLLDSRKSINTNNNIIECFVAISCNY